MAILYDADGNEIEALTQEEVDVKIQENTDSVKQELESKLQERETELEKLKTKDNNFKNVRDKVKNKEEEINELKEYIKNEISSVKSEFSQKGIKEEISKLSGGDKEVEKKIEYHFNRFSEPADGIEDTRLSDAFKLATGSNVNDFTNPNAIYSTGDSYVPGGKEPSKISEDAKDLGRKLGLKDEDFKK